MVKWEYNVIDQRDYLLADPLDEDRIETLLCGFGEDGWELVGWFGVWFIFKRKLKK